MKLRKRTKPAALTMTGSNAEKESVFLMTMTTVSSAAEKNANH
ncbi:MULTISPECIES: hypothetical protein [Bacillus]|nr:hypothetical protein [Bacillus haynesii]MEC1574406.1 hypothetical protein [Bacillus haynesii]